MAEFPVTRLLQRAENTFAEAAQQKGLSLRVVPCCAWVRSDFILLERILSNLLSNAIRYTQRGGLVLGCRRRHGRLRIEVWDTGSGIPADQQDKIFGEFYRLGDTDPDRPTGLGLGLAIVDRLCKLLGHSVSVKSTVGKGSVFAIELPAAQSRKEAIPSLEAARRSTQTPTGKLVVVIDDDRLVREGMGGIFRSWGCKVVVADCETNALAGVKETEQIPDLIISDFHLSEGKTGAQAIEALRAALGIQVPAFLISGDTNPASLEEAKSCGLHLLHKPVDPMALRAMFQHAIRQARAAVDQN